MTKGHDLVHGVEDHGVLKHSVVVELPKVFDFGDTALVELKIVLLEAERDRLNHGIDNADDKLGVIAVNGAQKNREKVDISVLDLSGFREDLVKDGDDLQLVR